MFCDAHFHLVQYRTFSAENIPFDSYRACTCSHDRSEYSEQQQLIEKVKQPVFLYNAFGIHPQNPVAANLPFLEALLRKNELDAIGEAGFDLFTPEFKATIERQEVVWRSQVELAVQYQRPLIIHCRKSLDRIFRDSRLLMKLPGVIFHSFSGSITEAGSFLRRGIPAFFSFGKPLLNGHKRALECVRSLPAERLLFETDAPFQTLKNESFTTPGDIYRVYTTAAAVRLEAGSTCATLEELKIQIEKNFISVFGMFPVKSAEFLHRNV
ncbi:MAG: TatD family hydrolase [Treponema sp.]|jgi:TatD DNase family protein|nr:TatD family hydrolase [Treponema sp.]